MDARADGKILNPRSELSHFASNIEAGNVGKLHRHDESQLAAGHLPVNGIHAAGKHTD